MRDHLICCLLLTLLAGMASLSGCSESSPKEDKSGIAKIFSSDKDLTPEEKARAQNVQGLQVCAQNNYAGAIPYFKKAVELDEKADYYTNLGRCYYWIGRYGDALRAYARAEELGARDAGLKANIGDVFRQRNDLTEAMKYYHQAISLDPDFARGHYELGNMLMKQGRYDEAIERLTRVLTIDPGFSKAMLARLICYRLTRQFEKAYQDLRDLDRRGYEVQADLKHEILAGVKEARANKPYSTN